MNLDREFAEIILRGKTDNEVSALKKAVDVLRVIKCTDSFLDLPFHEFDTAVCSEYDVRFLNLDGSIEPASITPSPIVMVGDKGSHPPIPLACKPTLLFQAPILLSRTRVPILLAI
jgi:hypothetical protein